MPMPIPSIFDSRCPSSSLACQSHSADAHAQNTAGSSALQMATERGHEDVQLLLEGAEFDDSDDEPPVPPTTTKSPNRRGPPGGGAGSGSTRPSLLSKVKR